MEAAHDQTEVSEVETEQPVGGASDNMGTDTVTTIDNSSIEPAKGKIHMIALEVLFLGSHVLDSFGFSFKQCYYS